MTGDVALTSALRNNLLTLQNTQRQADETQFRLATGKKVNSALDNPLNFFRAQSFGNRARKERIVHVQKLEHADVCNVCRNGARK